MPTQIINNGASLKIVTGGVPRNISKQQIREISIVNTNIIKLDLGMGALKDIFIPYAEVDNPSTETPAALADAINAMLASTSNAGLATEQKQDAGNTELQNIKNVMTAINNKVFEEPFLTDEVTIPGAVIKGFAPAGSDPSAAVWAIQKLTSENGITSNKWADGNKNFDNVWNDRATLTYL